MMAALFLVAAVFFLAAYQFYGKYLEKRLGIDDARGTPSHTDFDGVDRVPAPRLVLLGHHFSSIAGAGPIVGPIIAGTAFGWLPVILWVALGSVFIGGVHDFSSLAASIRHRARSVAEIAREHMSPLAYKLFLAFIWLALVYVLVVFTDLTAGTFTADGGVASSSLLFIILAVGFGAAVYRLKVPVLPASLVFVPLVFVAVFIGQILPIKPEMMPKLIGGDPAKTWDIMLLLYCLVASTTPVWILLQPRDYLSSFLLYASVLGGCLGIVFGGFAVSYPAFIGWQAPGLGALFPILFITVACGACSGFHSVVASGTSSKQLDRERDAKPVGYGAMLIEGLVAVIALATVMILAKGDALAGKPPLVVYGSGMGSFLAKFGLPFKTGYSFGLLALSTFILTTLDTATRLGRYIFEEFTGIKGSKTRYLSTLATLFLPAVFVLITLRDSSGNPMPAWKAIWPVFGATNQLLAGLALLVVTVWLKRTGQRPWFTALPMAFMVVMTVWALILLLGQYRFSTIGTIALVLLVMSLVLMVEVWRALFKRPAP
jgi:carbon starvation protein